MGNFAPVVGECEIGDLEVEGTIPASVRGVYLRNGPNPAREPLLGAARYHWFDGDGMLHWIRLGDDDDDDDDALEEKKKSPSSPSSPSAAAFVRPRVRAHEKLRARSLFGRVSVHRLARHHPRVARASSAPVHEGVRRLEIAGFAVLGRAEQKHRQQRREGARGCFIGDVRERQRVRAGVVPAFDDFRRVRFQKVVRDEGLLAG
jgi:hypothetical protein